VSPKTALSVGLKVDSEALPKSIVDGIKKGTVDLNDPATTIALLKLKAVVGVTGFLDGRGKLTSVGIQCAFCHSTVDDSFAPGIGRRRDGWPNRDLNVGEIVALSPDLSAMSTLLGVDDATVRKVLASWGPGRYDAELDQDGKAFRPDGKSAATLLPAAFGLAGVNLHTYNGWGSVTYWNAYVAITQMHGKGTFFDPRLNDASRFPVAAKAGFGNVRNVPDLVTAKLCGAPLLSARHSGARASAEVSTAARRTGASLFSTKRQVRDLPCSSHLHGAGQRMHTGERSGSTISRRAARRTRSSTGRRPWPAFHPGEVAVSTTMADFRDYRAVVRPLRRPLPPRPALRGTRRTSSST
jgi:hypothetical protein